MRVVPLTPLLSMVDTAGEEFRWDLFLAFKAASIVFSEIQTSIQNMVQVLKGPPTDWPPVITTETSHFPSITKIEVEADAFPDPQLETLEFVFESRHDNIEHRHLYHARLVSPASSDKAIFVKFSQRYSLELHRFCASQGLAPKILGFQKLYGGWFAVVMEKIELVDHGSITSFPEVRKWKEDIKKLVEGFHQKGLVHGDLRLPNFLLTKDDSPRKMLLIDFDWGGKDGEVEFPHGELIGELEVSNSRLHGRKITKEHDRKCLDKVVTLLENCTR